MKSLSKAVAASVALIGSSVSAAIAAPPASLVGTWGGLADQTEIRVVIQIQGSSGTCRILTGFFQNPGTTTTNSTLQGWYCPATGRVSLLRKTVSTNDTFQVFVGNVASDALRDRIAGTFLHHGGGTQGESAFSMSRS